MAQEVALITGPIVGEFTLEDGTTYDVSAHDIPVASEEHGEELMYLIGLHHERHNHPHHDQDKPFRMDREDPRLKKFASKRNYKLHPNNTSLIDEES